MKRWKRLLLGLAVFLLLLVLGYGALLAFPYPLFKNEVTNKNVHIYYYDLPRDQVSQLAEEVVTIIRRSDLYNEAASYRIFMTSSALEYGVLTSVFYKSGGFYNALGNAFIRPVSIETNRVIKYDGTLADADLTLAYILAHETVHAMTADRIGVVDYLGLPVWIREGIAESASRPVPFATLLDYRRQGNAQLDVRSHLLLYALRVHFLRQVEGLDTFAILHSRLGEKEVDSRIDRYLLDPSPR